MSNAALKTRQWTLAALVVLSGGFAVPAVAQESADNKGTELEQVTVTGSLIRRIDVETSLPVTTLSRDQIQASGVNDMEQLIQYLTTTSSANAIGQAALAGLSTYGQSSVSLRGLGDVRTLVLMNGRRLGVFAGTGTGVDINAIPLSAIERVEVLRDGASTIYGSDAVAGVINFILRKDYNGAEVTAQVGRPTQSGGGGQTRYNILLGQGGAAGGKLNWFATANLDTKQALFARDRDFSRVGNNPPYYFSGATETGRIEGVFLPGHSLSENARNVDTNPFGTTTSGWGNPMADPQALGGAIADQFPDAAAGCASINMFDRGLAGVGGDKPNCGFDSAPFVGLFPKSKRYDFLGRVHAQISNDVAFYFEGSYSNHKVTEAYQPSPVRIAFLATDTAFAGSGVDPALLIFPSNPNYATYVSPYLQAHGLDEMDGQPLAVSLRTFLTGPRTEEDTNTSWRFVQGFEGSAYGWHWDVGGLYTQNETSGRVIDGYFSQLALARIINDPANNWNPWAPGGVQAPALDALLQSTKYNGPTLSGTSRIASLDGSGTHAFGELPGGAMQLAVGATVRREYYKVDVPTILGTGDIAGLGGATLPEDDTRTVQALYSEMYFPILRELEANASIRWDHYNDVGTTFNGKLSTRYQPIKQVLIRAAAGTGFRAPTLVELHQPVVLGTSEQFIDPLFQDQGPIQSNAFVGGNPQLDPETSRQVSAGLVLAPIEPLSFGADWFLIKVNKYIVAPAAIGLINAVRAGHPLFGPDDATFAPDGTVDTVNEVNRNAATALVSGIDTFLNWSQRFPFGKVGVDFNGTYIDRWDLTTLAGTEHSLGTIIDESQEISTPLTIAGAGVVERWQHTLSAYYSMAGATVTFSQRFYDSYRDANIQDDQTTRHDVPSYALYDAQVGYKMHLPWMNEMLDVAVGANNIFDRDPPLFIGNGSSFQFGYDPTMWDPRGRFVYARMTYKFL